MSSFEGKLRPSSLGNSKLRHIDIQRKDDKNEIKKGCINAPRLWKKEMELCGKESKKEFLKKGNEKKYRKRNEKSINNIGCDSNTEGDFCNINKRVEENDLLFAKKKLLIEIATNLWNKLNVENESAIDLFNDETYVRLSEEERKIFRENFLSHFIADSKNGNEIKIDSFAEKIDLKDKNKRNISELKRIAVENKCGILLNCDKRDLLSPEKPILIVPEHFFFQTIHDIVMNVDGLDDNRNSFLIIELLKMSKRIHMNTDTINNPWNATDYIYNRDENARRYIEKQNREDENNKIKYSIKEYFPMKKDERILLQDDYKIIERENIVNDLIHLSIRELSKNVKLEDIEEHVRARQNDKRLIKHKQNNEKIYASLCNKRGTYGYDPLKILKQFLDKDSNILDYKDFLDEMRCCTFQPNVYKYIEEEKKHIKEKAEVFKKEKKTLRVFENEKDSEGENEKHLKSDTCNWILKSLKKPLYDVENIDMSKYLKIFEMYYCNQENTKKTSAAIYNDPTHRKNRSDFRNINSLNKNNRCVEVKEPKKSMNADYKNKWANELRGGYRSNTFRFSLQDKDEKKLEVERSDRSKNVDWGKQIRLTNRRMKTRVIPNSSFVNEMVNMDYTDEEEPTSFVVKQKSVLVYDSPRQNRIQGSLPKRTLLTLQQHKKEFQHDVNSSKTDNSLLFKKTNFLVPTPIKTHKRNRLLRMKNELKGFGELTSFAPPKVVAVESETLLDDIKNEILSLPESIRFLKNKPYNG